MADEMAQLKIAAHFAAPASRLLSAGFHSTPPGDDGLVTFTRRWQLGTSSDPGWMPAASPRTVTEIVNLPPSGVVTATVEDDKGCTIRQLAVGSFDDVVDVTLTASTPSGYVQAPISECDPSAPSPTMLAAPNISFFLRREGWLVSQRG